MLTFLIQLLVVLVVLSIVWYIIRLIPLPPPFQNIATIVVLLIFLIWLLGAVGVFPSMRFRASVDRNDSIAVVHPVAMRLRTDRSRVGKLPVLARSFEPGIVGHFFAARDLTRVSAPAEAYCPVCAALALL